jgi:hypothetical protein
MWHGMVGADDNSFLVAVASRQELPYNQFHFLNVDFQPSENRQWKLPRPFQHRMTRSLHSSKRRERKVELDVEDFPLSLSWREM